MKPGYLFIIPVFLFSCKKEQNTTPPSLTAPFVNTGLTKKFLPFGIQLSPGHENPAYEIILTDSNQFVLASCAGTINWIRLNDNFPDYEIEIIPYSNSVYRVYYDHIKNPAVTEGAHIDAGDVIGKLGVGGRTELQINDTRDNQAYCPTQFGNAAFNNAFNNAVTISNSKNGTSYVSPCTKDVVTP